MHGGDDDASGCQLLVDKTSYETPPVVIKIRRGLIEKPQRGGTESDPRERHAPFLTRRECAHRLLAPGACADPLERRRDIRGTERATDADPILQILTRREVSFQWRLVSEVNHL